jgi:hypothetical protein
MLSHRAVRLRDWALFAAAALVPAISVGIVGLRALSNEADGARREVALELTNASARMFRALEQESARASAALAALPLDGAPDALATALAGVAPPFAEPVLLARDRSLLLPASHAAPPPPAAPALCGALARTVAAPLGEGRAAARCDFLARCAEARAPSGRWLWPVIALDTAGVRLRARPVLPGAGGRSPRDPDRGVRLRR